MLLKLKFTGLLLLLLGFTRLYAQDSTLVGKTIKWDLSQCIDYAKKNNIQINSLRLSKQTSQQELELAKAAKLPDLSGSATQDFTHYNTGSNRDINGVNGNRSSFVASGNYGVSSSVTLFNGGLLNNTISQKGLVLQSSNLSILQQENDITLQITQAYLAILLDKENILYNTDLVNTTIAQVKLEQQRYDVGSVARKDLIQLQAQQATDQYTLTNLKNTQRSDLLTLKQYLLLPSNVDFDIVRPDTIVTSSVAVTPLNEAQDSAYKTRPEIKNGQLAVQISQYDIARAKAGYLPSLVAGGSIGSNYATGSGSGYFNQIDNGLTEQIGLTLAIPIFTRRVVRTQVEEAKISVQQSKLDLQNTKYVLSQTVERAYINVQNGQGQYDAANEQFKFSKEAYRIASEQLKVGAANTVDFLLQKNLYVQAQQEFVQAKYNLILSLRIYDFYRGQPIKL